MAAFTISLVCRISSNILREHNLELHFTANPANTISFYITKPANTFIIQKNNMFTLRNKKQTAWISQRIHLN